MKTNAKDEADSKINGIRTEDLEETVNAIRERPELGRCRFRASNRWTGATQNCTRVEDFFAAGEERNHTRSFELFADEPGLLAGDDRFPNPVEHLLNALAGCVTTSLVAHAAVRGIVIRSLESELEGDIDLRGFLGLDPKIPKGFTAIRVRLRVETDETDLEKLRGLAGFSPVYNTLNSGTKVGIELERMGETGSE